MDIGCLVTFIPSLIPGSFYTWPFRHGVEEGAVPGSICYPLWIPGIGALSCIGLIAFLNPNSWIIGCIGLLIGIIWFFFHKQVGT